MQKFKVIDSILILFGFVLISFLFRVLSISTVGTLLTNFLPDNDHIPVYSAVGIAILLSGFVVGKIIVSSIKQLPLYHALAIAIFACLYKIVRPDLNPVSSTTQAVFLLLTFSSILAGTYIARIKSA